MAGVDLKLILYQKVIISMINMKADARDAQSAEIQRIIEDTINLPAINNLDYRKEPITASFGLLLLYAQIYRNAENKEEVFDKIVKIINEIRPFMNFYAQHRMLALFGGLCDLGVSLLAINKETGTYHNLIESVNEVVASGVDEKSMELLEKIDSKSISMRDYDAILGLSGMLRYLLLTDIDLYRSQIQKAVATLIHLSLYSSDNRGSVLNWYIKEENVFPPEERKKFCSGMVNFGLSHGIAGPLAVLSISKLQGVSHPGLEEAIERLIEFFLQYAQEQPDGEVYWPSSITGEEYLQLPSTVSPHKRLSWCYGALSILRIIFLASKATKSERPQKWAVDKAVRFSQMPLEMYLLESPTICHGYAGALLLFESFYRDTQNCAFLEAIERLQRKICTMNSLKVKYGFQNFDWIKGEYIIEDDLSLLSGTSGILLALGARQYSCDYVLAHLLIN